MFYSTCLFKEPRYKIYASYDRPYSEEYAIANSDESKSKNDLDVVLTEDGDSSEPDT